MFLIFYIFKYLLAFYILISIEEGVYAIISKKLTKIYCHKDHNYIEMFAKILMTTTLFDSFTSCIYSNMTPSEELENLYDCFFIYSNP